MKLIIDTTADSYESALAVMAAAFGQAQATDTPHLNFTPEELEEQGMLTDANGLPVGIVSNGNTFRMSPEAIAVQEDIARRQGFTASPPATQSQAAQSASASSSPTIPTGAADVDKNGIPWDARIHAGTKGKTQKGEWKRKKGVDDALVATVEAELRAAMARGGNAPAIPGATALPAGGILGAQPTTMPPMPALNLPMPNLPPQAPAVAQDFGTFVAWATEHVQPWNPNGDVPLELLAEALAFYQVVNGAGQPDPQALQSKPDMIPHVHSYLLQKMVGGH